MLEKFEPATFLLSSYRFCDQRPSLPSCLVYPMGLSLAASNMATIFSGGTSAIILCTCWNTNPPLGLMICMFFLTCWRICSGVPLGKISLVSQPPPQKAKSLPNSCFNRDSSMSLQLNCTGLIISSPASIRSFNKG